MHYLPFQLSETEAWWSFLCTLLCWHSHPQTRAPLPDVWICLFSKAQSWDILTDSVNTVQRRQAMTKSIDLFFFKADLFNWTSMCTEVEFLPEMSAVKATDQTLLVTGYSLVFLMDRWHGSQAVWWRVTSWLHIHNWGCQTCEEMCFNTESHFPGLVPELSFCCSRDNCFHHFWCTRKLR